VAGQLILAGEALPSGRPSRIGQLMLDEFF
jgi:hypothetical protein